MSFMNKFHGLMNSSQFCSLHDNYSNFRDRDLLYPSCGTNFNQTLKIRNDDDVEQLCGEMANISNEKIIQKHFLYAANSDLHIVKIHACEIYITKFDYASVQ